MQQKTLASLAATSLVILAIGCDTHAGVFSDDNDPVARGKINQINNEIKN